MPAIKLTSKRQATFPVEVCRELNLRPGDLIRLERRVVRGAVLWCLRPGSIDWSWVGAARKYAGGKSHRWSDIEKSISKGVAREAGR